MDWKVIKLVAKYNFFQDMQLKYFRSVKSNHFFHICRLLICRAMVILKVILLRHALYFLS